MAPYGIVYTIYSYHTVFTVTAIRVDPYTLNIGSAGHAQGEMYWD